MTTRIDHTDKVMQIYNQYYDILTMRSSNQGEPDLRTIAASLTQAHFMERMADNLKELVYYEDLKTGGKVPSEHR